MCGFIKITRKNKTIKKAQNRKETEYMRCEQFFTVRQDNNNNKTENTLKKVTRRLYIRKTIEQFVDVVFPLYLTFLCAVLRYSITHMCCVCNTRIKQQKSYNFTKISNVLW